MIYTAGSNAVRSYFKPLRMFGAQVRRVLLDNAAKKLGVPVEELDHRAERGGARQVRPAPRLWRDRGVCRDPGQGARDQARAAQEDERVPADRQGHHAGRAADARSTAARNIPSTCRCPGMLYGAVVRAPVEGSAPERFDEAKVRAIAGVVKTVRCPTASASSPRRRGRHSRRAAVIASSATWSKSGKAWGFDSEKGHRRLRRHRPRPGTKRQPTGSRSATCAPRCRRPPP